MYKYYQQGQLKPQSMFYVEIEHEFTKVHSNLYRYEKNGAPLEFVSNVTPAVGGFIVALNAEPPIFVGKEEFHNKYLEAHEWQQT